MTTIKLFANDRHLRVVCEPKLTSGDKKSVEIQVDFSSEWNDYTKSAVFFTDHDKTVYEVILADGKCIVPHEVLRTAGVMFVGVRGVTSDAVKPSSLIRYRVARGAPVGDGTAVEPTPDVYQQILARLNQLENPDSSVSGKDGKDGVSCTHTWNGTVLTVTSASGSSSADLKGEKGEPGQPGKDGPDYVLTDADKAEIAEQAALLVEIPDSGQNGEDGFSPIATVTQTGTGAVISITDKNGTTTATVTNGKDGADGKDGQNGADGYIPVRGTDYWTAADIAEIKSYVDTAILGGAW